MKRRIFSTKTSNLEHQQRKSVSFYHPGATNNPQIYQNPNLKNGKMKRSKSAFVKKRTHLEANKQEQPTQRAKTFNYAEHYTIKEIKSGQVIGLRSALCYKYEKTVPGFTGEGYVKSAERGLYDIVSDSAKLEAFILPVNRFCDIPHHIMVIFLVNFLTNFFRWSWSRGQEK